MCENMRKYVVLTFIRVLTFTSLAGGENTNGKGNWVQENGGMTGLRFIARIQQLGTENGVPCRAML